MDHIVERIWLQLLNYCLLNLGLNKNCFQLLVIILVIMSKWCYNYPIIFRKSMRTTSYSLA
ncbi:hypothetical protein BDW75DRAFT_226675 [Aspergillus navahoensis]